MRALSCHCQHCHADVVTSRNAVTEGKRKGRWVDDDDDQPAGNSASGSPSSAEDGELPQGTRSGWATTMQCYTAWQWPSVRW